ncbi:MAG: 3-isopropylmalate dehydratase large subunit [Desulfurococcales archaeon]|nr:3-isopropylmalate dehydratase large subunit [Desulfurococcales archaeon]
MTGMTLTEKILSAKVGRRVSPGDFIVIDADLAYAHDGTAPLAIKVMKENERLYRVHDPSKVLLVIDHASPPPNVEVAKVHEQLRSFAREFGVRLFDVGEGICHQVVAESGLVRPGAVVVGADSHTVTLGALSAFATGVGSTDIAIAFALGKIWLRIPESIKVLLDGKLKPWVTSKDVILNIIGNVRADGLTYLAAEFQGTALKHLSVESRMTISNMCVEVGAKAGLFPADEVLASWLRIYGADNGDELSADPGAEYKDELNFNLSKLEPQVAAPPNVDNVREVSEVEGTEVDQVFIGSCTNGRYEDFLLAAKILKGRRVKEGVRCVAIPASRKVFLELLRDGVLEVLAEAGCFIAHSTCGPCIGAHLGLLGPGEVAVSTSNRNFVGRMGHRDSKVYLASPATAAAAAVEGRIVNPKKYLS